MPYKMGMENGQHCIFKEDTGALVKGSCHADEAVTKKMFAALNMAMETENKAAPAFALPATDEHPDKFPLGNKKQIEGAITSVMTGSFRGNAIKPALTDGEKSTVKANIRKAINASGEGQDWKDQELARLEGKELDLGKKDYWDDEMMPMPSMPMKMEPSDPRVKYGPLQGTDTKACANCQFFCARNASCQLIWDDVVPTGLCNLWLSKPALYQQQPIPVVIVDQPVDTASKEDKPKTTVDSKESPILAWLKNTFGKKSHEELPESGFKALPGNKWVSFYSNSFADKSGEIFTEAATDQYIEFLDKGLIPYPDLLYWHILGTKHGQAEWIGREGHINVAAGSFDDSEMANLFRKEYEREPYRTSHTYGNPVGGKDANGHFVAYFDVELSPLPVGKEANEWTPFLDIKEMKQMPITPEKRAKLEAILGKELAAQTLDTASKMSAELEAVGLKWKEAESLPAVDTDAREAIQAVATANKEALELSQKAVTDALTAIQTGIKAIQDGETARNERLTKLETFVKEQFADAPRATTSKQTVVMTADPEVAALAAKAADPTATKPNPDATPGENIAHLLLNFAPKGQ